MGSLAELVGDQNPGSKALLRSKKKGSKQDAKRGPTARRTREKVGVLGSWRGRRSEETTQTNTSTT